MDAQELVRSAIVAPHVKEYAARLTMATHPEGRFALGITNQYIRVGASPRAAQALMLATRARALVQGRLAPSVDDVSALAHPVLIHRMALGFAARARGEKLPALIARLSANVAGAEAAA